MLYFWISLLATLIGAITGLGGGVFIKPLLDAFTQLDTNTISVISAFCVLTMAAVSVVRYTLTKVAFQKKTVVFLGVGAIPGGILGKELLQFILSRLPDTMVKVTQNAVLALLLTAALLYMNLRREKAGFHIQSSMAILAIGCMLGTISSFLGIGGGPINVMALCLLFAMNVRQAAVHSVAVIVFSQVSKLISIAAAEGIRSYELDLLLYMLPAAVIGGLIGALLNQRIRERHVFWLYNGALVSILLLSVWNIFRL